MGRTLARTGSLVTSLTHPSSRPALQSDVDAMALFALELSDALSSRSLEVSYASALSMVNDANAGTLCMGGSFAPPVGGSMASGAPTQGSAHASLTARGGSVVSRARMHPHVSRD